MDCCGQGKPKENDTDEKASQMRLENGPAAKRQTHGWGCCGGTGMWLHLVIIIIIFVVIWFFTKR